MADKDEKVQVEGCFRETAFFFYGRPINVQYLTYFPFLEDIFPDCF